MATQRIGARQDPHHVPADGAVPLACEAPLEPARQRPGEGCGAESVQIGRGVAPHEGVRVVPRAAQQHIRNRLGREHRARRDDAPDGIGCGIAHRASRIAAFQADEAPKGRSVRGKPERVYDHRADRRRFRHEVAPQRVKRNWLFASSGSERCPSRDGRLRIQEMGEERLHRTRLLVPSDRGVLGRDGTGGCKHSQSKRDAGRKNGGQVQSQ